MHKHRTVRFLHEAEEVNRKLTQDAYEQLLEIEAQAVEDAAAYYEELQTKEHADTLRRARAEAAKMNAE